MITDDEKILDDDQWELRLALKDLRRLFMSKLRSIKKDMTIR